MIAWGNTTDRIMHLLQDNEMTKVEICQKLNLTHDQVSGVLTRLKRKSRDFDKRIYICGYTRDAVGKRYYRRPLFTAGNRKDVPKPPAFTSKERSAKTHIRKMNIKKAVKLNQWMTA